MDSYDTADLAPIPAAVAAEYAEKKDALTAYVDKAMNADPLADLLTGGNQREMMYDNHRNHAEFIANVLRFSKFDLLYKIVPWVYNSYHAHGFSYDYFPKALERWKEAVRATLSPAAQPPVLAVYDWMLARHEETIELAELGPDAPEALDWRWREIKTAFVAAVLAGETHKAKLLAEASVTGLEDMRGFYLEVLQPAMYEIGRLWQKGEISVAQEHLATSIAGRAMASFYTRFMNRKPTKGAAVITAAPNEFHELGGRMIADFLEIDGWDTAFLGANTPGDELIKMLRLRKPELLGISVMMPFNLDKVAGIIEAVRAEPELSSVKIMVGGGALNLAPEMKGTLKADGWALDAEEAVALANSWRAAK